MTALEIFAASNGEATKALYTRLESIGPMGFIAMNLFRACKASQRAKVYRGGGFRGMAYEKKNWSQQQLCDALNRNCHPERRLGEVEGSPTISEIARDASIPQHDMAWGWKKDPAQEFHNWVLYVELPTGQVSFHAAARGLGPDYPGDWDGLHLSAERITRWCDQLLTTVRHNNGDASPQPETKESHTMADEPVKKTTTEEPAPDPNPVKKTTTVEEPAPGEKKEE